MKQARLYFRLIAALCLWLAVALTAHAKDIVTDKAWFEDKTGALSFQEIQQQPFTSYTGLLSRGFTSSTYWLRLRIDPNLNRDPEGRYVIRIQPSYIDTITLYDPLATADQPRPQTGDLTPWSNDSYRSLNFNFVFHAQDSGREVYLKIQTESSMLVHAQVLPMKDVQSMDSAHDLLSTLMIGFLFFVFLWSLQQWWLDRGLITGLFLIKQGIVFVHATGYTGYWRVLFSGAVSPEVLGVVFNSVVILMTVSAAIFMLYFMKEYRPARWTLWVMGLPLALLPVQLGLYAFGYLHLALNSIALLSLVLPVLLIYMAISTPKRSAEELAETGLLSKRQLILLTPLLFVVLWMYAVPALGIWANTSALLFGILFYNLASGAIMAFVVQARVRVSMRQRALDAERVLFLEREVERERNLSEERARFLDMLAHELRTPISTIRMLFKTGVEVPQGIERAATDMQLIVDRCVQAGRVESADFVLLKERFDLKSLLSDIAVADPSERSRLVMDFQAESFWVESDPHLLMIVIQNLIDNALKYSPPQSTVHLAIAAQQADSGQGFLITVRNLAGRAGLPDPDQVFDKYYRAAAAKHRSGSGLGLFLAQGICNLLGAKLSYRVVGEGDSAQAEFSLWLGLTCQN